MTDDEDELDQRERGPRKSGRDNPFAKRSSARAAKRGRGEGAPTSAGSESAPKAKAKKAAPPSAKARGAEAAPTKSSSRKAAAAKGKGAASSSRKSTGPKPSARASRAPAASPRAATSAGGQPSPKPSARRGAPARPAAPSPAPARKARPSARVSTAPQAESPQPKGPKAPAVRVEPKAPAVRVEPKAPAVRVEPKAPAESAEPKAPVESAEPAGVAAATKAGSKPTKSGTKRTKASAKAARAVPAKAASAAQGSGGASRSKRAASVAGSKRPSTNRARTAPARGGETSPTRRAPLAQPGRVGARASEPPRAAPVSPGSEDLQRLRATLDAAPRPAARSTPSSRPTARSTPSSRPTARSTPSSRPAARREGAKPWPDESDTELMAPPVVVEVAPLEDDEAEALRADHPGAPKRPLSAAFDEITEAHALPPAIEVADFDPDSLRPPPPTGARNAPSAQIPVSPSPQSAEDELYGMESTIERLVADVGALGTDPRARKRAAEALAEVAAHLGGEVARGAGTGEYYDRRRSPDKMRGPSDDVDDFGLDRAYEASLAPALTALYERWFRVRLEGASNIPSRGRCLLVANHGGALPWDGLMLRTGLRRAHPSARTARWLVEDFVFHTPFLGAFVNRVGAVRACPENAERLLASEQLLAVFPEGEKGAGKVFARRYELQRFGRGGYVKLALRTGTPIVPVAIVGAEEAHPMLFRSKMLAKLVGLPFLPVTPTFPWLGPLGLIPLPSRWVILIGEPIDLVEEGYDESAADDPVAVSRTNDRVRGEVQALVRRALEARESIF